MSRAIPGDDYFLTYLINIFSLKYRSGSMNKKTLIIPIIAMMVLALGAVSFQAYNSTFDIRSHASSLTPPPKQPPELPILVNKTSVVVTINRNNIISGFVYGPGFTITSQGATAWQIKYTQPTQGAGFYESAGGIVLDQSTPIRTYITTNLANGRYSGSAVVMYYYNNKWYTGPTVSYTITLTGTYTTPSPTRRPNITPTPTPSTPVCSIFDLNNDGYVTQLDVDIIQRDILYPPPINRKSDINKDGFVDVYDLNLLIANMNTSTGPCHQ
jgi:hypothetical protein